MLIDLSDPKSLSLREPGNQPHAAIEFRNDPIDPSAGVRKQRTAANVSSLSPRFSHGSRRAGIRNHLTACSDRLQRRSASRYRSLCPDFFKLGDGSPMSGRKCRLCITKRSASFSIFTSGMEKVGTAENQEVVISHFKPRRRFLRNRLASKKRVPGDVQVFRPKLPGALYNLARYNAVPQKPSNTFIEKAICHLLDRAASVPMRSTVSAHKTRSSNESFSDC